LSKVSNKAVIVQANGSYNVGPIIIATINAAGSGYAVNDTGVIDPTTLESSGDATYIINSVDGGGAVTGFTVSGAGTV
jgi:hypothetical protein